MKAAIYVMRGENQRELEQLVLEHGWQLAEVFTDGVGRRAWRPGFHALLAASRERRFGAVVVHRSSTFARTLDELVSSLALLQRHDVRFVSATEDFESLTSFEHVIDALAGFQRAVISQRTREGMHARRKRGLPIGRPRRGLDDTIAAMRAAGHPMRAIAEALNVGFGTVQRALRRAAP